MDNEGSWAVVLPDHTAQNNQMMQQLWQHNMMQQRLDSVKQQREFVRQANAAKFVGENFKDANYATGTAADPLINQKTAAARQKFAKLIHENPNMDEGELEVQMQGDLSEISQYSSSVKALRKGIEEGAQHYQQVPGVDSDQLKLAALNNGLFDTDPNGKRTLKPTDKIDLTQDYLGNTLNGPDGGHFIQGDTPYVKAIENYKPQKGGDTQINERSGVTTENKYSSSLYPHQSLKKDDKGNIVGAQTNSVPATLSNGQTLNDPKTGKPLPIVDDETFNRYSSPGVQASLRRDVSTEIQKEGFKPEDFPVGSEGYNVLAKHVMYNKLNELTPSEFTHETKKTNANFVDRQQAGLVDALGRSMGNAEEKKKQALLGSNYGKMRLAANMDPTVLSGAVPYTDPGTGKNYLDITNVVGGFNTLGDTKGPNGVQQVAKVMVDPSNPGTIYTEEQGQVRSYKGKDLDGLLTMHAPANGHKDLKDVKLINQAIPINPTGQSTKDAQDQLTQSAKALSEQHAAAQSAKIDKGIDAVEKGGDGVGLKNIIVPDGKVSSVSVRGSLKTAIGMDKYAVEVSTPAGKSQTVTFPTKEALQTYLKSGAKTAKKSTEELGKQYGF